ncbi:hypothetical protein HXX76_013957 [Chlamydomonas incerta]|uniref:Uncharacterized protein n=1 Tax=Chlamydomonas incerta TaxID=51695 RepID=A0A835SGN8_CHLIN|nr:hypothetical protein HXX76_013957 [Chlamydomonas incerta]|eukprot:KAG2425206.1 hypothetical protein HXX76_013957 [Chlamydomonas incerta]
MAAVVNNSQQVGMPQDKAPVIASARVGRGRMVVFGAESMLTGCCGLGNLEEFDPTELDKILINAANWTSWYGTKTGRKAIMRVSDKRLVPVAKYIASKLPNVFATPKEFNADFYLPLTTFAKGGSERCDVYLVMGADPVQSSNQKVKRTLRSFLEMGKGILLAGPVVVAPTVNTGNTSTRRILLDDGDEEAPASSMPSDEWTRPDTMFGRTTVMGGNATAVNVTDVPALNFRELLSMVLDKKGQASSAEFAVYNARLLKERADLDASDIAQFDDALRAKVAEYDKTLGKPAPSSAAARPSPPRPSPSNTPPSPKPSTAATPSVQKPPAPIPPSPKPSSPKPPSPSAARG